MIHICFTAFFHRLNSPFIVPDGIMSYHQPHQIRFATSGTATTVKSPATAMDRLLMAPSISPISSALAVPTAWALVPSARPFATGWDTPVSYTHLSATKKGDSKTIAHRLRRRPIAYNKTA